MPDCTCEIKTLPRELWAAAASAAIKTNPMNAPGTSPEALAAFNPSTGPAYLSVLTTKYWGNTGVRLTVGFLDNPSAALRSRILQHMNAWGKWSNVSFLESSDHPQVRITRIAGKGHWSYLGTDIMLIAPGNATMNLDDFTESTVDSEFYRVIRHETGHTLGFPHEHARKEIVDRIDREKAIAYFMSTQGWSREQVIAQVLTPLDNAAILGTDTADPNSIMCYWLPAAIMKDNTAVSGGRDIDDEDAKFAAKVYPKRGPYQNRQLEIATTFANETDGTWFMADSSRKGVPDLFFIKTSNTPNNRVEIHIASGASQYQRRVLETETCFANENNGTWLTGDFTQDGKPDLIYIKTANTPNGFVELHIADAASNYQNRIFETETTFACEANGTWLMTDYTGDGHLDLVYIKTSNTPSNRVEVHIASGKSGYKERVLETSTTFVNEPNGSWFMADYDQDGIPDLIYIKESNTPSKRVEVHIASAASHFQQRILEIKTTFMSESNGRWLMIDYADKRVPDLAYIKTASTPSNHVEVHLSSGSLQA